jgi:hypothetical protein
VEKNFTENNFFEKINKIESNLSSNLSNFNVKPEKENPFNENLFLRANDESSTDFFMVEENQNSQHLKNKSYGENDPIKTDFQRTNSDFYSLFQGNSNDVFPLIGNNSNLNENNNFEVHNNSSANKSQDNFSYQLMPSNDGLKFPSFSSPNGSNTNFPLQNNSISFLCDNFLNSNTSLNNSGNNLNNTNNDNKNATKSGVDLNSNNTSHSNTNSSFPFSPFFQRHIDFDSPIKPFPYPDSDSLQSSPYYSNLRELSKRKLDDISK